MRINLKKFRPKIKISNRTKFEFFDKLFDILDLLPTIIIGLFCVAFMLGVLILIIAAHVYYISNFNTLDSRTKIALPVIVGVTCYVPLCMWIYELLKKYVDKKRDEYFNKI